MLSCRSHYVSSPLRIRYSSDNKLSDLIKEFERPFMGRNPLNFRSDQTLMSKKLNLPYIKLPRYGRLNSLFCLTFFNFMKYRKCYLFLFSFVFVTIRLTFFFIERFKTFAFYKSQINPPIQLYLSFIRNPLFDVII